MAKLPPKPRNIVHDYFPVGTDGHSPMNALDGSAWEAMKFKQGELDEDGKPIRTAFPKNDTDYYSENPIVDDPDRPGEKIRKKKLEERQKGQRVEVGEGASNELNEVVLTPNNKIETPVLAMQAGKAKKKGRSILGKNIDDYKKKWAQRS